MHSLLERRRSPRALAADASWITTPVIWQVQLNDVSLDGVAFTSPFALDVGRTICLRAILGRDAVNAQVRVCWSRPCAADGSNVPELELGGVFLSLDDSARRPLCAFLKL